MLLLRVRGFAKYSYANDAASLLVYPETDRLFIASLLGPLSVGAYAFYARLADMAANFSPIRTLDEPHTSRCFLRSGGKTRRNACRAISPCC